VRHNLHIFAMQATILIGWHGGQFLPVLGVFLD
jgi:hypothetical protein